MTTPPSSPPPFFLLFFLLLSILLLHAITATSNPSYVCPSTAGSYVPGGDFDQNLHHLLLAIASDTPNEGSFNSSQGRPPHTVFGVARCHQAGDYGSPAHCRECVNTAIEGLLRHCSYLSRAFAYLDRCQLGYGDESFDLGFGSYIALASASEPSPIGDEDERTKWQPWPLLSIPFTLVVVGGFVLLLKMWRRKNDERNSPTKPYLTTPTPAPTPAPTPQLSPSPSGNLQPSPLPQVAEQREFRGATLVMADAERPFWHFEEHNFSLQDSSWGTTFRKS